MLISLIVWFQSSGNDTATPDTVDKDQTAGINKEEPVIEVNKAFENFEMPVQNADDVRIVTYFLIQQPQWKSKNKHLSLTAINTAQAWDSILPTRMARNSK
ncbi:hypothetical protein ACI2OX_20045 [Bacillus sp. N9]